MKYAETKKGEKKNNSNSNNHINKQIIAITQIFTRNAMIPCLPGITLTQYHTINVKKGQYLSPGHQIITSKNTEQ